NGLFVEEAVDILLAVCAGVFAAHQLGVVHRDIKPRNIFLARNHMREIEPTVLDFGISKVDDGPVDEAQALTDSGVIVGTVQYVSPEHVRGTPTDARSDQYALGVVLYECLTGRLPHQGKTSYALLQTIAEGRFPPPSAIRGGIPPALEKQLLRAMSTEPNQRFDSVHTFGRALLEFASAKRRVMWAEYFGRPDALVSASGPPTRTSPIAVPMAPAKPTTDRGKPPAARTPQAGSARVAPPGETVYREPPALARPGKGRGRWMVWGLLLLAGGGATWAAVQDEHVLEWANGGRSEPPAATPRKETSSPQAVGGPAVPESPPAGPVSPPPAQGRGSAAEPTASANADDNTAAEEKPASPPQTTATGAAATTPPRAADPAPQTVSVQVSSTPSGAAVFLDDAEVSAGKTPVVLTLPRDEQPRVIWVRLPRHRPASRAAVLNEDQSIHLQLQRLSARPRNARAAESAEEAPEEAPIERHYQKLED
ncbi:MAG TPA: protein kinase, partial [Polyangia bacterium]